MAKPTAPRVALRLPTIWLDLANPSISRPNIYDFQGFFNRNLWFGLIIVDDVLQPIGVEVPEIASERLLSKAMKHVA